MFLLCWSVKGPLRPGGLMNGSASWVCQQISADALWVACLLLRLCFVAPLKKRASATDNYRQFKPGHSALLLRATKSAASTATTQLNFHHRLAKQQSTTKKISETTLMCRMNPGFPRDPQAAVQRLSSP